MVEDNHGHQTQIYFFKDCQSPEITSSKNKYCPARSDSLRKLQDRKTAKEAIQSPENTKVPGKLKSTRL